MRFHVTDYYDSTRLKDGTYRLFLGAKNGEMILKIDGATLMQLVVDALDVLAIDGEPGAANAYDCLTKKPKPNEPPKPSSN